MKLREGIREAVLANGMRIIVWPVRSVPSVAMYNWVRAGSRNEEPGKTGLAHFLEHMMFNGSSTREPGEFDQLLEAQGGSNNAFTTMDFTVYQNWFPREALEMAFDLESDRLANLSFDPDVFRTERSVVRSERGQNLFYEDLAEHVRAAAFVKHPYKFPVIGRAEDSKAWKIGDLKQFFKKHYAPNNQTLAIAGDVVPDDMFELAHRYFGPIPAQAPATPPSVYEPRQTGERRIVVRKDFPRPIVQYAYKAPSIRDERAHAVQALLSLLVDGKTSRLRRALMEQHRVMEELDGNWDETLEPGLLWLDFVAAEGMDADTAQSAIDAELTRIVDAGFRPEELRRVQNLHEIEFWKWLETLDGKAYALGECASTHGDWRVLFDEPEQFRRVTLEQVHAVAREVLDVNGRTAGVLLPAESQTPPGKEERPAKWLH